MILVIDNYDSFTYNIVQYLAETGAEVHVVRNDQIDVRTLKNDAVKGRWNGLVISPGPGRPDESGCSLDAIRLFAGLIPIFGVCLGHQCMGQLAGAKIIAAKKLMHGKVSEIRHDGKGLFEDLPNPLNATRYHSLAVEESGLSKGAMVSARTEDGEIMGLRLDPRAIGSSQLESRISKAPIEGVQFHPESILTEQGRRLIGNFVAATEVVR